MTEYKLFQQCLKERYEGPYCATDIIIQYDDGQKSGIVLIERKFPPLGLALPGGIAERMPLHQNAVKEAKEETGLDVVLENPLHPFLVLSEVEQDPRAFIASITYLGRGLGKLQPHPQEDARTARVYTLEEISDLLPREALWAFVHHRKILEAYLDEQLGGKI